MSDIVAYTDGSIDGGNPGGWAVGGWIVTPFHTYVKNVPRGGCPLHPTDADVVRECGEDIIAGGCHDLGSSSEMTNNMAEYCAVWAALDWVSKNRANEWVLVRSDSKLIVSQLTGSWKCAKPSLVSWRDRIWTLEKSIEKVTYEWVPRARNREADAISRYLYDDGASCNKYSMILDSVVVTRESQDS